MDNVENTSADTGQENVQQAGGQPGQNQPQAEVSGTSLLTREDKAEGTHKSNENKPDAVAGKDADAGKKQEADPDLLVPEKADDYKLAFADGITVDEGLLKDFKTAAHELGIPQGQAQKLADFYARHAADSAMAAQEAQNKALQEAKKGWEGEITSRPGFKQEVLDARRTLKEFGSPELNALMDQSLMGSHPVFFDFVVKVGKALAEPEARGNGTGGGREKPLADRLWPNM